MKLPRRVTHSSTRTLPIPRGTVSGRIVLDLRLVEFIEPFGIVYLHHLARDLLDQGASEVVFRTGEPVGGYLARMDFPKLFDDEPRISFRPDLRERRMPRHDQSARLVEATTFEVRHADDTEALVQRALYVMLEQKPELAGISEQLNLTLSELIDNIEVHSGGKQGVLVAQTIRSRVLLAFGDRGVGIPQRIRTIRPELDDCACIQAALEQGVSTRAGRGGMGLTMLKDELTVAGAGARMSIRSGTGHVAVYAAKETPDGNCTAVRGTIVEVAW